MIKKDIEDIISAGEEYTKKRYPLFGLPDEDLSVEEFANLGCYVIDNGIPKRGTCVDHLFDGYKYGEKDYAVHVEKDMIEVATSCCGGRLTYRKHVTGQNELSFYMKLNGNLNRIIGAVKEYGLDGSFYGDSVEITLLSPSDEEISKLYNVLSKIERKEKTLKEIREKYSHH